MLTAVGKLTNRNDKANLLAGLVYPLFTPHMRDYMRIVVITLLLLVPFTALGVEGEMDTSGWYSVSETFVCEPVDPTHFIAVIKSQRDRHLESGIGKEGKVMAVFLPHLQADNKPDSFVRGLNQCELVAEQQKWMDEYEKNK